MALHLALEPVSWFEVQAIGGFLGLAPRSENPNDSVGTAWRVGGGIRFKRPYSHGVVSPWIDADADYVRTGGLDRFGYTVGAGVGFGLGARRMFRLGPYVRYEQIVDPRHESTRAGIDTTDAKVIVAGLSLEVGSRGHQQNGLPDDRDGDGIPDVDDQCPDAPEDRDGYQDNDGCPDLDNDGDGLPDAKDACPNEAEDKDGFQDDDGCPDLDNDGDGIPDVADKCPMQAEDKDGFEDEDGCPDPDNDKDGLVDKEDACPNAPGTAATNGCPDRDGDNMDDQHDECPDVPGPAETHGCPVYKSVKVTANKIEITQKIFFANNLTKILSKSFPLLDEVTKALKDHSGLRVRVEGHTDSRGKIEHNRELSIGRADAVRAYLVAHGVASNRLESKGYGPDLPIDSNATVSGRENNRRVEFVVITEGAK